MNKKFQKAIGTLTAAAFAAISCFSLGARAAVESGVYTAAVNAAYSHPVTGDIEDSGGKDSQVLGQSMVESVLYKQALLEVDEGGNTYANVRYNLADQISDIQFAVQEWGDTEWMSTQASIMQENAGGVYCTDYRILLTSQTSVVRSTFYVEPMGRYVIFYFYFSNTQAGNTTDFIQTVTQASDEQTPKTQETQPQTDPQTQQTQTQEPVTKTPQTQAPQTEAPQTTETKEQETEPVTDVPVSTKTLTSAAGTAVQENPLDGVEGLSASKPITTAQSHTEGETAALSENENASVKAADSTGEMGQMVKLTMITIVSGVVTGLVLMSIAGGVLYFIYKQRRDRDDD